MGTNFLIRPVTDWPDQFLNMRKFICCLICCYPLMLVQAQKFYISPGLSMPFSGISYAGKHNDIEFRPSIARINLSWSVNLIYKPGKLAHKLTLQQVPLEKYFKLINKFMLPPNTGELGISYYKFGTAIDHFILSYAVQKEAMRTKGFLFNSLIKFNYSLGAGIGFNRTKSYYNEQYLSSEGGSADTYSYMAYRASHHRNGTGVFIQGAGGFDFISRKIKRKVASITLFYNQGLTNMTEYNIHYQYGFFNDPNRQVDVPGQKLISRGTIFGLNVGFPITILK